MQSFTFSLSLPSGSVSKKLSVPKPTWDQEVLIALYAAALRGTLAFTKLEARSLISEIALVDLELASYS